MRHEVHGDSIDELATEAHTSQRALANRLARARATLRVEFTLAHRHIHLPTDACRPVLLALSTGDRRRQHQLDTHRHLKRCPTCSQLAEPITHRRRSFPAWILVPVADAGRRLTRSLRHNSWTRAAAATVVAAAAVTAFAVTRSDPPSPTTAPAPPPATATTTAPATTATPTTTTTPQLTCPAPVPLDRSPTPPPIGCAIAPTAFTAIEVPADEGFWARDSTGSPLWIQLAGTAESPIDITPGAVLAAAGTIADLATAPGITDDKRAAVRGFVLSVRYEDITAG